MNAYTSLRRYRLRTVVVVLWVLLLILTVEYCCSLIKSSKQRSAFSTAPYQVKTFVLPGLGERLR